MMIKWFRFLIGGFQIFLALWCVLRVTTSEYEGPPSDIFFSLFCIIIIIAFLQYLKEKLDKDFREAEIKKLKLTLEKEEKLHRLLKEVIVKHEEEKRKT